MSFRVYTREQLLFLRDSPRVKKPDDLPPIEQWIEYVYADKDSREKLRIPHSESAQQHPQKETNSSNTNNARRTARPAANGDASPMGNFSTGQRPSLLQTRSVASRTGDDIVLGPPKTAFASSRTLSRLAGSNDAATPSPSDPALPDEPDNSRVRTFGDRQPTRKGINEKETRDNRDSWTAIRERRALADLEEPKGDGNERNGRYGRRERDREHETERRNGDKPDTRWGHKDEKKPNGDRQGGWRDRENNRNNNRGWDRGEHVEKDPEWFDEPVALKKQDEDLNMSAARTQEDFQKWKEMMNARSKGQTEEPEPLPVETTPPATREDKPAAAPIKLEGFLDKPFGGFGETKSPESNLQTPGKSAPGKGKSSRFASMFTKKEELPPAAPEETPIQRMANEMADGSSEDKEGFQRILQMLGGTGINQGPPPSMPSEPTSPQPKQSTGGSRQKSRFFDSVPKSPERLQSPQVPFQSPYGGPGGNDYMQSNRGMMQEPAGMFGMPLPEKQMPEPTVRTQPPSNPMSPESIPPPGMGIHGPSPGRPNGPPSRNTATPDVNIQNLLAAQRPQRQQGPNKDSEFLLGLLQGQTASRPPSQPARPGKDFSLWLEQPPEPHAPKPRAPLMPGQIDDQLLRNAPQEMHRQEHPTMPGPDMLNRRAPQRAPPGFDEQMLFNQQLQQQRRNFTEPPHHPQAPPNRRMSGHPGMPGMPGMPPQQHPQFPPDYPFMQSPVGGQGPPAPGFPPNNMRHPQGFPSMPNMFQNQPPQQQQREPPIFPPGMMQGPMSPPHLPPGFGGPPPPQGMPPGLMQMRMPADGMPPGFRGHPNGRFEPFDGMAPRR